jgi:hypothetical protein
MVLENAAAIGARVRVSDGATVWEAWIGWSRLWVVDVGWGLGVLVLVCSGGEMERMVEGRGMTRGEG